MGIACCSIAPVTRRTHGVVLLGALLATGCGGPAAPGVTWHPVYLTGTGRYPYACGGDGSEVSGCFVRVEQGTFRMGAQATDPAAPGFDPAAKPDEAPTRMVHVSSFWIQREEVSAGAFQACVDKGGCKADQVLLDAPASTYTGPDPLWHPANSVSWEGARQYCAWIGARLPTEAEWEYAARGTDGRRWPWGNDPGCGPYPKDAGALRHDKETTSMGQTGASLTCVHRAPNHYADHGPASAFGLAFMGGNVWEWVADWHAPYDPAALDNPKGPATGTEKVQRGGGWTSEDPNELRAAGRASVPPDQKFDDVGFRCAIDDAGRLMVRGGAGKAP